MTRNTIQVRSEAVTEAARMPSLALSRSAPANEMSAMSRETVKPMPATVPTPISGGQGTVSGSRPNHRRENSQVKPVMPTSFPTTKPNTMPRVIGEAAAARSPSTLIGTPALARANRGTIT